MEVDSAEAVEATLDGLEWMEVDEIELDVEPAREPARDLDRAREATVPDTIRDCGRRVGEATLCEEWE